ncbi:MAG: hypothetical protein DRP11_03955 [Candidatus Aenigmatarchaeota archaeon]|nr:MAG: hypothetical protein DRP11_03955 [Candidatus Aenigmarchaeota archaeon]
MTLLSFPRCCVSAEQLRRLFNELELFAKVQRGELQQQIRKDKHPAPPKADEPFCTRSQIVAYYDSDGNKVALVHQYLRPDGTLGASGLPDPKMVLHGNVIYYTRGENT